MDMKKISWKKYLLRIKRLPDDESQRLYWKCVILKYKKQGLALSPDKWKQFKWMCDHPKYTLLFCRGGGKTLLGAHFITWRAIKYGEAIWAANSRGQLTEFFKHLKSNPFITLFKSSVNRQAVTLLNGTTIHTIPLTESAFLGKHTLTLMLDEVARMDETLIGLIRKTVMKGGIEGFLSTPVLGTFFQTLTEVYDTLLVTYLQCGDWIDIEEIQKQMKQFPSLIAMYKREYLCEFTALDGAIFPNLEFITQQQMNDIMIACTNIRQGMDFNTMPGHVGIRVGDCNNKTYVLQTAVFPYGLDYTALKGWVRQYKTEVEDGGANKAFQEEIGHIDSPHTSHQAVPAQFWMNRIGIALSRPIVVVEGSDIAKDLSGMMFKNGKIDMNPHHWVAAFLHAIGAVNRYFEDAVTSKLLISERKRDRDANRRTITVSNGMF